VVFMMKNIACTEHKKVVVIGAGIAGLTTAYRLAQNGIDVHLYEAKPRVGGRILTALVDGHIAELGGQNIFDGAPATNMINLINELGLTLNYDKIHFAPHYVDNNKLTALSELLSKHNLNLEKLEVQLNELALSSSSLRVVLDQLLNPEDPVNKCVSTMIAGYEGTPLENLSPRYTETLMHMLLGGVCTAHSFEEIDNNRYFDHLTITGGNSLLPQALAQQLDDRVHLNMPLKWVSQSASGQYQLTFQDGQVVHADVLVLANPCSTYGDINFESNVIPESKLTAIRHVQVRY
jgi:monoamine oxidase